MNPSTLLRACPEPVEGTASVSIPRLGSGQPLWLILSPFRCFRRWRTSPQIHLGELHPQSPDLAPEPNKGRPKVPSTILDSRCRICNGSALAAFYTVELGRISLRKDWMADESREPMARDEQLIRSTLGGETAAFGTIVSSACRWRHQAS